MATISEKGGPKRTGSATTRVEIDGRFVREQANTAVRQFFRPITAPFQFATQQTSFNREEAGAKGHSARKR